MLLQMDLHYIYHFILIGYKLVIWLNLTMQLNWLNIGLAVLIGAFLLARGALRASSKLHKGILDRGLKAPMSFFESTPTGRIINRFAKDIDVVDTTLPSNFDVFSKCTLAVFGTLFVISFNTPIFIVVVIPLSVIYFFVQVIF